MTWLAAKRYPGMAKKFTYTIQHYDLEVKIDLRRLNFVATASVSLTATKSTNTFCFLLSDECTLTGISYLGLPLANRLKPLYPGRNLISSVLPRKADVGERLVITLNYRGTFPNPPRESLELAPSMYWYPFNPYPQKYSCTLRVVSPDSIRIVGVGELLSEQPLDTRMLTQWKAITPFRGIHMLAGEFLKTTRENQHYLEVYYPRKLMNQGKRVADICEKLACYYTCKLGPAPAPSTTFILTDNSNPGINTSLYITSIHGGSLEQLRDYPTVRERNLRTYLLMAREMGKRWIKHGLTVEHPSHLWYLDGLAEYLSWLALEAEFGAPQRELVMQEARELVLAQSKRSITREAFGIREEFDPWLVAKASWLLHAAHCLAGDAFLPALQEYYIQVSQSQYAPSPAEFFKVLGNMTGTDLDQLYKEWAQGNGELVAVVSQAKTFQDEEGQWQLEINLENHGKLKWPYPLDIKLDLADGSSETHKLCIAKDPHLLKTEAKTQALTVDPAMKFLNWAEKRTYTM